MYVHILYDGVWQCGDQTPTNQCVNPAYTVKPLYCGQHWDKYKCPDYRGVLISGVNLYYKAQFGTFVSVLNTGVSSFQGVLNRGVSLYYIYNYVNLHV